MAKKRWSDYIETYWNRHSEEIITKINKQNPRTAAKGYTKQDYKEFFFEDVKTRMEEHNETARQAIKKRLNSRVYKSQADFYAESLKEELLKNREEYNKVRDFYRDKSGRFTKWGKPIYAGKVEINNMEYSKYKYLQGGQIIYVYTSQSPKSEKYNMFVSTENYE